jgi:hypothetical protein
MSWFINKKISIEIRMSHLCVVLIIVIHILYTKQITHIKMHIKWKICRKTLPICLYHILYIVLIRSFSWRLVVNCVKLQRRQLDLLPVLHHTQNWILSLDFARLIIHQTIKKLDFLHHHPQEIHIFERQENERISTTV